MLIKKQTFVIFGAYAPESRNITIKSQKIFRVHSYEINYDLPFFSGENSLVPVNNDIS